jgi:hypothetical protein
MTLWRRAPREVYRVYGEDEYREDEYLGEYLGEELDPTSTHAHEEDHHAAIESRRPGSHSGRLVGLGLLVGVTVGALGLVVLNASHRSPMSAGPEPVAHASSAPISFARAPARPPMRSLAMGSRPHPSRCTARLAESAPSQALAQPWQAGPSESEHPELDMAAPPVDREFGFER